MPLILRTLMFVAAPIAGLFVARDIRHSSDDDYDSAHHRCADFGCGLAAVEEKVLRARPIQVAHRSSPPAPFPLERHTSGVTAPPPRPDAPTCRV
jgi:hypothetical protein